MALVTGFGGANADLHIRADSPVLLRDSNPSSFASSPGGVTRNILENLAHLGLDTALLSAVGQDANGDRLLAACKEAGIDVSRVKRSPSFATAGYVDFLGPEGDMFVAANDMKIIDAIPPSYPSECEDLIRRSDALVTDANLSAETLERFAEIAGDIRIFADPVSVAKAPRMKPVLNRLYLIKPNVYELAVLSELPAETDTQIRIAAEALLKKGVYAVAVSLGTRGCYYADRSGESFFDSLPPVEVMGNATGAGDAWLSGAIYGTLNKKAPRETVRLALAAGRIAVRSTETINPQMSAEQIEKELLNEL